MKKAFAYMRVSGKGQIDGDGFPRQEKAIREYAESNGFEIVAFYREEGISGTLADRPALAELLLDIEESPEVNAVIIEDTSRLSRKLFVQETIIGDLKENNVDLLSATEGDLVDDDPERILFRQIKGALAQYEKTKIVMKLKAARDRKKKKTGKCEGRKNYSEVKPEIISAVKRLNRKPRGGKRLSSVKIAERMNAEAESVYHL